MARVVIEFPLAVFFAKGGGAVLSPFVGRVLRGGLFLFFFRPRQGAVPRPPKRKQLGSRDVGHAGAPAQEEGEDVGHARRREGYAQGRRHSEDAGEPVRQFPGFADEEVFAFNADEPERGLGLEHDGH